MVKYLSVRRTGGRLLIVPTLDRLREEYGQFERDLSGEIINLILKVVLYKGASCVYILTLDRLRERSKNSTVTRS